MKKQQGFTLIELMIVVAIIGILAAIALPAYQDYTARAQAAEALTLTAGVRTDIAESIALTGSAPAAAASSLAGKYVADATWDDAGNITVTFKSTGISDALRNKTLELRFNNNRWECNGGDLEAKYIPSGCKP